LITGRHPSTIRAMSGPGQAAEKRGERIAKVIARSGLCSRRAAEALILGGHVTLNGKVLESPAVTVGSEDQIRVDGKQLAAPEPPRLWRYHKSPGLVTTTSDPQGRPTIFARLPAGLPRVVTIGRLDITTEGLLLLTNDGGLARALELPKTGWLRRYRVRVHGVVDEDRLARLAGGITLDGIRYRGIDARLERRQGTNAWISMALREGKHREVKTVLAAMGLEVTRLIRTSFGPFSLGALTRGEVEEVPRRVLREQLPAPFNTARRPEREPHAHYRR
jgi:23S rRNA pseudouridine2605 synthase